VLFRKMNEKSSVPLDRFVDKGVLQTDPPTREGDQCS
jgi:hypothetical protein